MFVFETERSTIRQRLDKFGSFFYYSAGGVYVPADGAEKGECTPDDAFYAPVRLHAIAPRHIRVSPYPDGDRCKATPLISTNLTRVQNLVNHGFWALFFIFGQFFLRHKA